MLFKIIVNLFEVLAALVGTLYFKQLKYRVEELTRYFIWFLWLTVFVELVFGWTPWFIKNLDSLTYLEESFLSNNHWAYNIYFIVSFLFYVFYFKNNIKSKKMNLILNWLMVIYFIASISSLIFTNVYFIGTSHVTYILGSILIFLSVMLYFYETLQSDKILSFHKFFPFYVAIGSMVFHLVVTPLFIYIEYYKIENPEFVQIRRLILYSANIFMYTCYTVGFIVCSKRNKSYS